MNLFRPEVLAVQRSELSTHLPWSGQRFTAWAAASMALLVLSCGLLLNLTFAEKVVVAGVTQSSQPPTPIVAPVAGTVGVLHVQLGQPVTAGQVLGSLNVATEHGSQQTAAELEMAELWARHASLQQQQQARAALAAQTEAGLRSRANDLSAQLQALTAQELLRRSQLAVARDEWLKYRKLRADQYVTGSELAVRHAAFLQQRQNLLSVRTAMAGLRGDRRQVLADAALASANLALDQARLQTAMQDVSARVARLRQQDSVLILAPHAGRLGELSIHLGAHAGQGQHLLTITPDELARWVRVWVPVSGVGRISVGQQMHLKFAGFPHQQYGFGQGVLEELSSTPVLQHDQVVYPARAKVVSLPQGLERVPVGMSVSAEVLLRRKPLWRWLLEPLRDGLLRL
ncbi:MAG: HlyD family efflux transporter periplasmic adaptor subunit [Pseudomonadota bacterium]